MEKKPITITATTLGRASYNPDYSRREYMDRGDIPNHVAAILAFIRQDLKPNEKVIVMDGMLRVVEKTAFDRFIDWAAGRKSEATTHLSAAHTVALAQRVAALLAFTAAGLYLPFLA